MIGFQICGKDKRSFACPLGFSYDFRKVFATSTEGVPSLSHVLVEQKAYFDGPGFNINSTVLGIHLNDFRRPCVAQGAT